MEIIIFQNSDETIGIIYPTAAGFAALGIQKLGEKDTPTGLPFWIAEETALPADRTMRAAWRLDGTQGDPDGYGD